jgi:hypothetical protein
MMDVHVMDGVESMVITPVVFAVMDILAYVQNKYN